MSPDSRVLGFDTSGDYCAVALARNGLIEASVNEQMKRGQAEKLFGLIFDVLEKAETGFADIGAIGVGIGPGSFTGTRVSVAAARGISLSAGMPAIGVSRFDALICGASCSALASIKLRNGNYLLKFGNSDDLNECSRDDLSQFFGFKGVVIGDDSEEIAKQMNACHSMPAFGIAEAIALKAASRAHLSEQRPAPLYARPFMMSSSMP